jgi:acyl carrier protein
MQAALNQLLAQVFNLESPDTIRGSDSLIADLGADSLDFVEILHLIERTFGVVVRTDEILLGGSGLKMDDLFVDGRLSATGAGLLRSAFPAKAEQFNEAMTKVEMFSLLTVADLLAIIQAKQAAGVADA